MLNLVLFGPPGAGKGTQSNLLIQRYNLIHLSTGDILRGEIAEGTVLGLEAKALMDKGDLVPDDVTTTMLKNKIESLPDSVGYILDGFPRTLNQAISFDNMLAAGNSKLDLVICIDVPGNELEHRLLQRMVCSECSSVYGGDDSVEYCESCGGKLYKRVDDSDKEVIGHRLKQYEEFSLSIINHYESHGILHRIDGTGSISTVTDAIKRVVANMFKGTLLFNY